MLRAQPWQCLLQAKVELAVFVLWMEDQGRLPQTWLLPLGPQVWVLKVTTYREEWGGV